jgi:hypothetical protein
MKGEGTVNLRKLACAFVLVMTGTVLYGPTSSHAAQPETVQAMWKTQEIQFAYMAFTTSYNCDALETKLENVLRTVGAHEQTRVDVRGCEFNRVSRNSFVRVTAASPVLATPEQKAEVAKDKSREELLKKLGVKSEIDRDEFPAVWKKIDLSRDRTLGLQPGDCELLEHLRDRIFPKLAVKVVQDEVRCTPNHLPLTTPKLEVSALVKAPSPDEESKKQSEKK